MREAVDDNNKPFFKNISIIFEAIGVTNKFHASKTKALISTNQAGTAIAIAILRLRLRF